MLPSVRWIFNFFRWACQHFIDPAMTIFIHAITGQSRAVLRPPCASKPWSLVTSKVSPRERKHKSFGKEALLHLGETTQSCKSSLAFWGCSVKSKADRWGLWLLRFTEPGPRTPRAGRCGAVLTAFPRAPGGTDTCAASRRWRSSEIVVQAISLWAFNGKEELPMGCHAALATAHSDQKFSFKRRASEAPNKGVLFPQPLCFAALRSGGRRAGKEMIGPFKFLIAYHSIRGEASQRFSSWMIYPGALVFPLPEALGRRVSK